MSPQPLPTTFPPFLPPAIQSLTEPTSIALAQNIRQISLQTPLSDRPIPTTYAQQGQAQPPIVLLHGFDSSLLEFRRLVPPLAAFRETWALDLLGFGFGDRTLVPDLTPAAIKQHIHSFWQHQIGQPVVLVGASMGGAAAIDFVLTYPDAVSHLVLLDSAGLAAGPAMGRLMFPPFDRWATGFLKNPGVRRRISLQAYHDKTLVTPDAEVCAALHLECPSWSEALIAFTKSGGYNFLTKRITDIAPPTLIVWGRQDKILGTQDATRFEALIPDAQLIWIDECGHVPHLEKAQETAAAIQSWLNDAR
ncbi:alpha/beta fold hydrolase [Oscillatoria sp. CS-180]|uniref:alpha/beta fold hydrolase n=1 Tax=Oscillatoria sp. CS-180 TaxID=3021720 RepID=UPI00232CB122|nr:alpha/beta fold hydrolase [Oscillatoria sp. CS-180]MDB9527736.1 alpha/beta fold hydrolase [Oscillatoria sp. CS-180]